MVFNTSLTGYQEILTDPSYEGQIVVMTASHIGNTGVNKADSESRNLFLSGFVVQEVSPITSNWRSDAGLHDYLKKHGVAGMTGVDTRALTRHLRTQGAVNGLMALEGENVEVLIQKAKSLPTMEGLDLAHRVSSEKIYEWEEDSGPWQINRHSCESFSRHSRENGNPGCKPDGESAGFPTVLENGPGDYSNNRNGIKTFGNDERERDGRAKKVVVIDFGAKSNILRCLKDRNCDVTVVPAKTSAREILDLNPDGVILSNGPGDPAVVSYGIKTVQELVEFNRTKKTKGEKPTAVFGICLGHQILGLALGAKTYKLKFGHHGANHPVMDLNTGKVDVTTQNHGFTIKAEEKNGKWMVPENPDIDVTHVSLNDRSVEGIRHKNLPLASVQYHPEASAGPHDPQHLFDRFMKMIETGEN